jgi:polyhydroxybutyrate depolymerase
VKRVLALLGTVTVLASCSPAAPTPPATSPAVSLPAENPGPGDHALAMVHNGARREYALHAPAGYRPGTVLPLVLVLHGHPGTSADAARFSGMTPHADRRGFLVAYPQGAGGRWNPGPPGEPGAGDVGFLGALIDHLVTVWGADRSRVYVTGFSGGAAFSYRLARELPGRFAAIAPVSGRVDDVPAWRQTPLGAGDAVSLVTFQGGRDRLAPVFVRTNDDWRTAAGCGTAAVTPVGGTLGKAYRHVATCVGGTEHVVYDLPAMGHEWPVAATHPVDATALMVDFFLRHHR